MTAAAGNVINDYFDWKTDKVAGKTRWQFSRYLLLVVYALLLVASIGLSFMMLPKMAHQLVLLNHFLLFMYAWQLKSTVLIGNFIIAFLSASTLLMLKLCYDFSDAIAVAFILFSFASSLFREIVKDLQDKEADQKANITTSATTYSLRHNKAILWCVLVVWIVLPLILAILFNQMPFYITAGCNFIACIYLGFLLFSSQENEDFRRLSGYTKATMFIGILTIVFY